MRRLGVTLTFIAAATAALVSIPAAAFASDAPPAAGGADVSYPQCDSSTSTSASNLPTGAAYGIVGLNHGLATSPNTCFQAEYQWAENTGGTSEHPIPEIYVNTADPTASAASWWPSSNTTQNGTALTGVPGGTCAHTNTEQCAYVYGYSTAERYDSAATGTRLWLDVETSNSWQSSTTENRADLAGMVAYFTTKASDTVGLYSSKTQFTKLVGTVTSTSALAKLDSWIAGSTSTGAGAVCESAGLTAYSRVDLVQYVSANVDRDLSCHSMGATAPVVTATGTTHQYTAGGMGWVPAGAHVSYQWQRNGVDISGAIHSTYTINSHDLGHHLSVKVSVKLAGYNSAALGSASILIP